MSRTPWPPRCLRRNSPIGDALAVARLGEHEQVGIGLDDAHPDDRVALALERGGCR